MSLPRFHPELLGWSLTKALVATLIELVYVKAGCYVLSLEQDIPVLDVIAYLGYKFVMILTTSSLSLLVGSSLILHCVFGFLSLSLSFFLLRSLRYWIVPPENSASYTMPMSSPNRRQRLYFLFSVAAVQVVVSYLLLFFYGMNMTQLSASN